MKVRHTFLEFQVFSLYLSYSLCRINFRNLLDGVLSSFRMWCSHRLQNNNSSKRTLKLAEIGASWCRDSQALSQPVNPVVLFWLRSLYLYRDSCFWYSKLNLSLNTKASLTWLWHPFDMDKVETFSLLGREKKHTYSNRYYAWTLLCKLKKPKICYHAIWFSLLQQVHKQFLARQ